MSAHSPDFGAEGPADTAWRFVVNTLEDADAEAFLRQMENDAAAVDALEEAAEDVVLLRCLGDAGLREQVVGAGVPGLSADVLLGLDHDPDARLDAALAAASARTSAWDRFRAFAGRGSARWVAVALAAAMVLLVVGRPQAPVGDYDAAWRNGAAAVRAESGERGRYLVGNVADLVVRPEGSDVLVDPEIEVFIGLRGGALQPLAAETEVDATGAVRVFIDVTDALGLGTHRVVVLVGRDLAAADPETDTDDWARVEASMRVVDQL